MLTFARKYEVKFMRNHFFIKEYCIQKMGLYLNIVIRKVHT